MGHGAELSYREEEACTVWSYLTDRPWGMGRGYSGEKERGWLCSKLINVCPWVKENVNKCLLVICFWVWDLIYGK